MRIDTLVLLAIPLAVALASCSESHAQDTAAAGPDITQTMILESAAGCRFDAVTNHALEGLLLPATYYPFTMTSTPQVYIGELTLTPEMERAEVDGSFNRYTFSSQAQFPEGTRWHGLKPTALHSFYAYNNETDHYEERGLIFADGPIEVQAALEQMGQSVPITPDYLELTDFGPFYGGCPSSIEIRPEGDGSALICGYGC
jgi:hypothetical protein